MCKTEIFIQSGRCDRVGHKVVRSGEDAFFCDAEAAGDNGELKRRVVFHRLHDALHHVQHLFVISVGTGLGQGHVVLIHQENDRLAVVRLHHAGQPQKAAFQLLIRCFLPDQALHHAFFQVADL